MSNSVVHLHPWQSRAMQTQAQIQMLLWHRQAGKDFAAACIANDDTLKKANRWFITSLTQRQADATHDKCKLIAGGMAQLAALKLGKVAREESSDFTERDPVSNLLYRQTARTLHFTNGGSITSMPGRNPDSMAGFSGNVIVTEFGLYPNGGYEHWRVILPLITRGYRILPITTPRSKASKAYDLATNTPPGAIVQTQTIVDSVREGFVLRGADGTPTTLAAFRELYGDEYGWKREYLCEFVGEAASLLRWGLIQAARERGEGLKFDFARLDGAQRFDAKAFFAPLISEQGATEGRLEIGWDVARRGDLSVVWINRRTRGGPAQLRAIIAMRDVEFARQRAILRTLLDQSRTAVGCGDASGLGMDSNETLTTRYGKRWEGVGFTSKSKSELASTLLTAFTDGDIALPISEKHDFILTDLEAVQRTGGNGREEQLRIEWGENPKLKESHCDIAVSGMLALMAAKIRSCNASCTVIE